MYTQPESKQHGPVHAYSGTVTFYTLLCFSLAGLIAGFAIGGFAGHLARNAAVNLGGPVSSAPTLTGRGPDLGATPTVENTFLGVPAIAAGDYTSPENADGSTSYHISAQIVNKADNTPISVKDVVCRLWLTDDPQGTTAGLSDNNYAILRNPNSFDQPFPGELQNALNFASSTPQTQPCTARGKTTWNYTLSNEVTHGTYYLVVLSDWKGVHYNWYMVAITIHNDNNNNNNNDNNGN
jgi:hypothetical protein